MFKRITRPWQLTPVEAAEYQAYCDQIAAELPELIARHHERTAPMAEKFELIVDAKGGLRHIHSDKSAALTANLGQQTIRRASHVEPTPELSGDAIGWLFRESRGLPSEYRIPMPVFDQFRASLTQTAFWADLQPVGGPVLGPFVGKQPALDAEVAWLREHNIPTCPDGKC